MNQNNFKLFPNEEKEEQISTISLKQIDQALFSKKIKEYILELSESVKTYEKKYYTEVENNCKIMETGHHDNFGRYNTYCDNVGDLLNSMEKFKKNIEEDQNVKNIYLVHIHRLLKNISLSLFPATEDEIDKMLSHPLIQDFLKIGGLDLTSKNEEKKTFKF